MDGAKYDFEKGGFVSASISTTPTGSNSTTVIFIYTAEFILTPPRKPNIHPGVRISLGKFKFSLKYLHPPNSFCVLSGFR